MYRRSLHLGRVVAVRNNRKYSPPLRCGSYRHDSYHDNNQRYGGEPAPITQVYDAERNVEQDTFMGEPAGTMRGWSVIRLRRQRGFYRDSLRTYRVRINGDRVGRIAEGETKDFPVPPGEHRIRLSVDGLFTSREITLQIREGELAEFSCRPSASTIASLVLTWIRPHRYIRLDGPD